MRVNKWPAKALPRPHLGISSFRPSSVLSALSVVNPSRRLTPTGTAATLRRSARALISSSPSLAPLRGESQFHRPQSRSGERSYRAFGGGAFSALAVRPGESVMGRDSVPAARWGHATK